MPNLFGYKTGVLITTNMQISQVFNSAIKMCFSLPKQSQRSRSILQDGSRSLRVFGSESERPCLITKKKKKW